VSSVSNGLYFQTLSLVSVMRVIYTSKGMSKKFGVRVIYRKIRFIISYRDTAKVCCGERDFTRSLVKAFNRKGGMQIYSKNGREKHRNK
jgi:hypothetical protein